MSLTYNDLIFEPNSHSSKERLAHEEVQADLQLLSYALERAYPARWVMDANMWSIAMEKIRSLSFLDGIRSVELGHKIADILYPIPDGHLAVVKDREPLGYEARKHMRVASCGANTAGSAAWKVQYLDSPAGKIPVVGISWFPQPSEPQWSGFLEEVVEAKRAPAVIIDLRGNPGGNDSKAIDMASAFLDKDLSLEWVREIICETAEAYALQINTYARIIWSRYTSKVLSPPAELARHLDELYQRASELGRTTNQNEKKIVELSPSHAPKLGGEAYKGTIFVLTDAQTASSGEWTALYLKQHPNTRLVGENTYGQIHFGNSGRLRLPHSGIEITLCMKVNQLTDGQFFEKSGITPDIPFAGGDSLNYVLSTMLVDSASWAPANNCQRLLKRARINKR